MRLSATVLFVVIVVFVTRVRALDQEKQIKRISERLAQPGEGSSSPQEMKITKSSWVLEYMQVLLHMEANGYIQRGLQKEKEGRAILADLIAYNWIHFFSPNLIDIKKVVPVIRRGIQNARQVEEEIKEKIKRHGEEKVTEALISYQYPNPGELSVHSEVKQKMEKYLNCNYFIIATNMKLKDYEEIKRKCETDPILQVHEFDYLMCLQGIYIAFYPNYDQAMWSSKPVQVNGITMKISGLQTSLLTTAMWEMEKQIMIPVYIADRFEK